MKKINFRIPGPTPLPPEVIQAISQQMINHRSHQYVLLQERLTEKVKHFFQTSYDLFLLSTSGTGAFDASISNFYSPGDRVLACTCGIFGRRWADAARAYGLDVREVCVPDGKAITSDMVKQAMRDTSDISGVHVTHNETSTGVVQDIRDIARVVKKNKNLLFMVDSISGLGAVDLPMDEIGIDVLFTASQKAWMSPPGICMIAVSDAAWERSKHATLSRYYLDLSLMKTYAQKGQTPATPSLTTLFGLDAALDLMMKEGRDHVFARHKKLQQIFRSEVKKIGLTPFVDDHHASVTVTSLVVPEHLDAHVWRKELEDTYHTVIAGGLEGLKDKIVRVSHMGYVDEQDIKKTLHVLSKTLHI